MMILGVVSPTPLDLPRVNNDMKWIREDKILRFRDSSFVILIAFIVKI